MVITDRSTGKSRGYGFVSIFLFLTNIALYHRQKYGQIPRLRLCKYIPNVALYHRQKYGQIPRLRLCKYIPNIALYHRQKYGQISRLRLCKYIPVSYQYCIITSSRHTVRNISGFFHLYFFSLCQVYFIFIFNVIILYAVSRNEPLYTC